MTQTIHGTVIVIMSQNNGEDSFNAMLLKQHELPGFYLNRPSEGSLTGCVMGKNADQ